MSKCCVWLWVCNVLTTELSTILSLHQILFVAVFELIFFFRYLGRYRKFVDPSLSQNFLATGETSEDINSIEGNAGTPKFRADKRGSNSAAFLSQFWVVPLYTVIIIALAMLCSFLVDALGVVVIINGALSGIGFIAVCPFLIGIYMMSKPSSTVFH